MQTVAKKAQDFGKFAAVLGASALVANVRARGPAARVFAGPGTSFTDDVHCGAQAASALTYDEIQGLTYLQVKGSGIANTCPVMDGGSSNLKDLKPGNYTINKFCLEPTSFTVKEESQFKGGDTEFVKTKLMTRLTYTLDEVRPGAQWRPALCVHCAHHLRLTLQQPADQRQVQRGRQRQRGV